VSYGRPLGFGKAEQECVGCFKVCELKGGLGGECCFCVWKFEEKLLAGKSDVGIVAWSSLE